MKMIINKRRRHFYLSRQAVEEKDCHSKSTMCCAMFGKGTPPPLLQTYLLSPPPPILFAQGEGIAYLNNLSISANLAIFPPAALFPPFSRNAVSISFLFCAWISNTLSSMLPSITKRQTVVGRFCPRRCTRSTAWSSIAGAHQESARITWLAATRLSPTEQTARLASMIVHSGSDSRADIAASRTSVDILPSMRASL